MPKSDAFRKRLKPPNEPWTSRYDIARRRWPRTSVRRSSSTSQSPLSRIVRQTMIEKRTPSKGRCLRDLLLHASVSELRFPASHSLESDLAHRAATSGATFGPQSGASLDFTRFLVIFAATHLFFDPAPLDQFAEATHRFLYRLPFPQRQFDHSFLLRVKMTIPKNRFARRSTRVIGRSIVF